MPTTTPLIKVNRTKSYGAEVVLHGDVYDEACAKAYELAEEYGYTFIHPFDDLAVATGPGNHCHGDLQRPSLGGVHPGSGGAAAAWATGRLHVSQASESADPGDRRGACQSQLSAGLHPGGGMW